MRFPADINYLSEMLSYVRTFFEKNSFSPQHIFKLELASEEALVNIISYAYPEKKGDEYIQLECIENEGAYEIILVDSGIPFNPLDHVPEIDEAKPLDERRVGGLGILLMRKLVSEISYCRTDGQNVLRIIYRKTR